MFFINWQDQTKFEIDCQYRALHEIVSYINFLSYELRILFKFQLQKEPFKNEIEWEGSQIIGHGRIKLK